MERLRRAGRPSPNISSSGNSVKVIQQTLDGILESLQQLEVDWKDDVAVRVIDRLQDFPVRQTYSTADLEPLFAKTFDDGLLVCRLFLGLSKDQFTGQLREALNGTTPGVTSYRSAPQDFLAALERLGVLTAMAAETSRRLHWSDRLVERLRSGRGSAISGQRRGRDLEDKVEELIKSAFGDTYESRCNFTGARGQTAKCDFAIPVRKSPDILIESKAYGATGSKMTDIIGDIEKIITAKRPDTAFLFVTDGLTW